MYPFEAKYVPRYGEGFKKRVRKMQPGCLMMASYGKVAAPPENRITVDVNRPDVYGIPTPVLQFRFGDLHRAVWEETRNCVAAMCGATVRMSG